MTLNRHRNRMKVVQLIGN